MFAIDVVMSVMTLNQLAAPVFAVVRSDSNRYEQHLDLNKAKQS